MLEIEFLIGELFVVKNERILEDPKTAHFVSGEDGVVHDLHNFEETVIIGVRRRDVTNIFAGSLGIFIPLKFEFYGVSVDDLFGEEVHDSFLLITALVDKISIIGGEIDDFNVGGNVFQQFVMSVELVFELFEIVYFDLGVLELVRGNQNGHILFIETQNRSFDVRTRF